jgi:hypothetical protein
VRKLAAVAILVAVAATAGGGARESSAAAACVPAAIHHGAPPGWTGPAWSSSSPGLRIPYSLASGGKAAAFFFATTLRAGHPTNPANKILWIVRLPRDGSPLWITARSGGRTVRASWPADSAPGQIYPSYVDLPTPGCWVITLGWHGHHATIDLEVHPGARAAAACPVSRLRSRAAFIGAGLGSGPVYPVLGGRTLRVAAFHGSEWGGRKMAWVATRRYRGPIVIRGRQLGGPGELRFGGARMPARELLLSAPGAVAVAEPPGWRVWPNYTRLRASGCYEFDVKGASLHERIVFRGSVVPTPGRRPYKKSARTP